MTHEDQHDLFLIRKVDFKRNISFIQVLSNLISKIHYLLIYLINFFLKIENLSEYFNYNILLPFSPNIKYFQVSCLTSTNP